jgi:extracellular factor (EF) 3-hydroxypalmitic acid methyl ester biosynthesis protein
MLYSRSFEGGTTFAKFMHKHTVDRPAAEAVRNRRHTIADWFTRVVGDGPQRLLSVACGPAQELDEILRNPGIPERLSVTLFDQDHQALLEAARHIDSLERALNTRVSVEYLRESVRTMLVAPRLRERWGKFDLIYSMGLFDYLTPPVASAVLSRLYQLLNPGGEMMIGNFHVRNPNRHAMEYWLDWVIYHRDEDEFRDLATDVPPETVSIDTDHTGIQMFLRIQKGT